MADASSRQAGDKFLDHYLPNNSIDEREAARENLRRLARLIIRVHERGARDVVDRTIRPKEIGTVDSKVSHHGV